MAQTLNILVAYYSLEGSTRFIANSIAKAVGADMIELKPLKPYPKGFLKFFIGGFQAIFGTTPELSPFDKNPADYDLIFLGTPVWASTYVPACRTFLSQTDLREKKIALFVCCGGDASKTTAKLRQALTGSAIIGDIALREPVKQDSNASKAADWAKKIAADASK